MNLASSAEPPRGGQLGITPALEIGVDLIRGKRLEVKAQYGADLGDGALSHSGSLRVGWRF